MAFCIKVAKWTIGLATVGFSRGRRKALLAAASGNEGRRARERTREKVGIRLRFRSKEELPTTSLSFLRPRPSLFLKKTNEQKKTPPPTTTGRRRGRRRGHHGPQAPEGQSRLLGRLPRSKLLPLGPNGTVESESGVHLRLYRRRSLGRGGAGPLYPPMLHVQPVRARGLGRCLVRGGRGGVVGRGRGRLLQVPLVGGRCGSPRGAVEGDSRLGLGGHLRRIRRLRAAVALQRLLEVLWRRGPVKLFLRFVILF